MHITVDASLTGATSAELEVAWGTPVATIVEPVAPTPVWCGPVELAPTHRAGEWPLIAGARLTARPAACAAPPRGAHLAVIAGPDAGAIVHLPGSVSIGTEPADPRTLASLAVADDTMDAHHAVVTPHPTRGAAVRDAGTVNGTTVWARSALGLRRGRRARSSTLRAGDVVEMGRTLIELRDGDHRPPAKAEIPDPTSPGSWTEATWIDGPFAAATARAVVLARGRRPPEPADFAEPWWQWLPPALPGDGQVWLGAGSLHERAVGLTTLNDRTVVHDQAMGRNRSVARDSSGGRSAPIVRVSAARADLLARAIAGALPEPAPTTIRWGDIASDRPRSVNGGSREPDDPAWPSWRVALGIDTTLAESAPRSGASAQGATRREGLWELDLEAPSPHLAVTGGARSGRTTLLATFVAGLAHAHPPSALEIVALCPRDPGPLGPCLAMPHVRGVALGDDVMRAADALSLVVELIAERRSRDASARDPRVVVVADDLDAFGPEGRTLWALCDAIARDGAAARVTLAVATARPTAVLSASLRATVGTMVALGASSEAESIELLGVTAAARLPRDTPGRAAVRSLGTVRTVQVALPTADPTPPVRPHGSEPPPGRHLAETCARDC